MFNYKKVARLKIEIEELKKETNTLALQILNDTDLMPSHEYVFSWEGPVEKLRYRVGYLIELRKERLERERVERLVREVLDKIKDTTPAGTENV